jgi:hypothetical protein
MKALQGFLSQFEWESLVQKGLSCVIVVAELALRKFATVKSSELDRYSLKGN